MNFTKTFVTCFFAAIFVISVSIQPHMASHSTKKYDPVVVTCLSTVCTSTYTSRECEGYCISKGYNNGECRALDLQKPVGPDHCCCYYEKR
ncbi:hypothetical protein Bca4012_090780 [Brassica carinata]